MKKSLSSFFEQVSEALVPSIEDDECEVVMITSEGAVALTGFQKHLAELQANQATYLTSPDATLQENYQRWLEIVDQNQFTQNQLARHLAGSEILNEKYLSLVPEKVPHMEFWKRYLFKRALLEDALAHAEQAERRAKAEIRSTKTVSPKHPSEIIQTDQPKAIQIADNENATDKNATVPTKTGMCVAYIYEYMNWKRWAEKRNERKIVAVIKFTALLHQRKRYFILSLANF